VVTAALPGSVVALQYLILHLNRVQQDFEFELVSSAANLEPLIALLRQQDAVSQRELERLVRAFSSACSSKLRTLAATLQRHDEPPIKLIVLSLAHLEGQFYFRKIDDVAVIALGDWKKVMAPPSLVEFFITLVLRAAVSLTYPGIVSGHLGTKGCLFDFNDDLVGTRFKVLHAFICAACKQQLETKAPGLSSSLVKVMENQWLGKVDEPGSAAAIAAGLGYNLFRTKGLRPSWWETFKSGVQEEWAKGLVKLVFTVLLAALLVYLGFKGGGAGGGGVVYGAREGA